MLTLQKSWLKSVIIIIWRMQQQRKIYQPNGLSPFVLLFYFISISIGKYTTEIVTPSLWIKIFSWSTKLFFTFWPHSYILSVNKASSSESNGKDSPKIRKKGKIHPITFQTVQPLLCAISFVISYCDEKKMLTMQQMMNKKNRQTKSI